MGRGHVKMIKFSTDVQPFLQTAGTQSHHINSSGQKCQFQTMTLSIFTRLPRGMTVIRCEFNHINLNIPFCCKLPYSQLKRGAISPSSILLLLLLLSRFSHVRLCVTPQTAAHQSPPSLGFSRQEHWSGLPFPSPMHESEKLKGSRSVVSNSVRPHGLQPTKLLHPWDFPGKSAGVGCHCLLRLIEIHSIKCYFK